MLAGILIGLAGALAAVTPLAIFWVRRSARQARLLERRSRQAQRLAELGNLTGGLAHEIRNPLATLRLNLDLLAEEWEELAPGGKIGGGSLGQIGQHDDLENLVRRTLNKLVTLRRETERLDDILEDFLHYAGQHKLQIERVDLNRVVRELLEFFGPQAAASHIQVHVGLTAEPLLVRLDANLFKQAVLNLLINAQQAMGGQRGDGEPGGAPGGEGGEPGRPGPGQTPGPGLTPGPGFTPPGGELIVRSFIADSDACLEIADTGPGIEPGRMDKIFEAYYSTKRGGTGLGLPTTRRIVEEHEGRIDVHSEPGKGTSFTIRLPLG